MGLPQEVKVLHQQMNQTFSLLNPPVHALNLVINPLARMSREGYNTVRLSDCLRLFWDCRPRGGLLAIPAALELRKPEN